VELVRVGRMEVLVRSIAIEGPRQVSRNLPFYTQIVDDVLTRKRLIDIQDGPISFVMNGLLTKIRNSHQDRFTRIYYGVHR
jgi:hypothetical protein